MIITFNDLYKSVIELPEDMRNILVIKLLADEKVSYDTISCGYIEYIQRLKREQTKEYDELQGCITKTWCGHKKDIRNNLDDCIRFLAKKGRVNLSRKQRDKLGLD